MSCLKTKKMTWLSAQRRLRLAWRNIGLLATHWAQVKTLIRLGGCPGWSESSLGAWIILLVLSCGNSNMVMIPSFLTDRCGQTVQIQSLHCLPLLSSSFGHITLWLGSLIVALPGDLFIIFLYCKTTLLNFMTITAVFFLFVVFFIHAWTGEDIQCGCSRSCVCNWFLFTFMRFPWIWLVDRLHLFCHETKHGGSTSFAANVSLLMWDLFSCFQLFFSTVCEPKSGSSKLC